MYSLVARKYALSSRREGSQIEADVDAGEFKNFCGVCGRGCGEEGYFKSVIRGKVHGHGSERGGMNAPVLHYIRETIVVPRCIRYFT
jgi:hypothetical protein